MNFDPYAIWLYAQTTLLADHYVEGKEEIMRELLTLDLRRC